MINTTIMGIDKKINRGNFNFYYLVDCTTKMVVLKGRRQVALKSCNVIKMSYWMVRS